MTIREVREGRALIVNARVNLKTLPACFIGQFKGPDNQALMLIEAKHKQRNQAVDFNSVMVDSSQFDAIRKAVVYYSFRIKKWSHLQY